MNTPGRTRTAKDLSLRYLELLNKGDYDGLSEVVSDDAITDWPQSHERISGLERLKTLMKNYPGGPVRPETSETKFFEGDEGNFLLTPMFTMVKAEGHGDTATSIVMTRYPDGSDWYIITMARAHDGKIAEIVQYFAPIYEAPDWRAQWVEPMD